MNSQPASRVRTATVPAAPAHGPSRRTIILSSSVIAATAAMLQVQMHEYAHGITAAVQGAPATISSLMAEHQSVPGVDATLATLAGPLFSIVLAVVLYAASRPLPAGYLRAFLTWMSFAAAQGTFGYLIVGMFMPVGDTAVLFEAWGFSSFGYIMAGVIGLAGMLFLSYLLSREILRTLSDRGDIIAASVLTWLVATAVMAVVYVSAALISGYSAEYLVPTLMGATTTLVFAPMATFWWQRVPHLHRPWDHGSPVVQGVMLVLAIAVVLWHALAPVTIG
ncbi:hypothetical protein [Citricoccus nitrophenolicus]|uniref:hypothetical protein n=1 Tax=Citricoccus nitrophenolicus TaxID=863575 RepID=UPI0031EEC47F